MKKKPSTKPTDQDLKDWNSFVNNITNIEDKDSSIESIADNSQNQKLFDIRKDLHGLKMHEALVEVSETINYAIDNKLRKILFITGKGLHSNNDKDPYLSKDLSLLKYAVPDHINNFFSEKIVKIEESPISLGGSGSIIVLLKK